MKGILQLSPRMEPCGTPHSLFVRNVNEMPFSLPSYLSERTNQEREGGVTFGNIRRLSNKSFRANPHIIISKFEFKLLSYLTFFLRVGEGLEVRTFDQSILTHQVEVPWRGGGAVEAPGTE